MNREEELESIKVTSANLRTVEMTGYYYQVNLSGNIIKKVPWC